MSEHVYVINHEVVAKLGRISFTQDEHTLRLERIEADIAGLRRDLPGIVADAVRSAMKP